MALSETQDASSLIVETQEQKAFIDANTITMKQLTSRLNDDPAFDLCEILKQQAVSYPRTRDLLADAMRRRTSAVDPELASAPMDIRCTALLPRAVQVLYPLQSAVLGLATTHLSCSAEAPIKGPLDYVDDRTIVALNERIKNGDILWNLGSTTVLGLDSSVAVKVGRSIDIAHISTLQYIQKHAPEVPTPDILGILKTDQNTYFFMSRIPGISLDVLWPKLRQLQKTSIQRQLNSIFGALRSIVRPQGSGDAVLGGGSPLVCKDARRSERVAHEPIKNGSDFNDFLCSEPGRSKTPWIQMIRSFMREDHSIVMTHGDLHPRNIMVRVGGATCHLDHPTQMDLDQDITITSILDWEMSGWYPEYWEFVKSLNTISPGGPLEDWRDFLPIDAIGAWPVEFAIDTLISHWLG